MIDSRRLEELEPVLRRGAEELIRRAEAQGRKALITSTYRDAEMQDYLYGQGRTRRGAIVTNAKGGYSFHNFRLAFDVCKNVKGAEYSDVSFFNAVGKIWVDMGGAWGGNFKTITDPPHMEFTNGLTTADLRAGAKLPQDIKMKWEQTAPAAEPPKAPAPEETVAALAALISLDEGYWLGVLRGERKADAKYLRALLHRAAMLAAEDAGEDAAYITGRLSRLIKIDAAHWRERLTGKAETDAALLKVVLDRVIEAVGRG